MKTLRNLMLVGNVLLLLGCEKDIRKDCGCDAPVTATITESASLIGDVGYNAEAIQGYNSYKDKFMISYTEINCGNCVHTMIVCNEDVLPSAVLALRNDPTRQLSVTFAGHLKPVCNKIFAPGDYTYEKIILTKIEIQ